MATLDASFVLDLNLFRHDGLLLFRRSVNEQEDGTSQADLAPIAFSGTVKPARGQDLVQTPAGDEVSGDIVIYTRRDLTAGGAEIAADVIQWDGAAYKVVNAQPWRYGTGYTRAVCQQMDINPSLLGTGEGEPDGSALDP